MYKLSITLLIVLAFTHAVAAAPSIGTASAHGNILIDGSRVYGNATIFDGTLIETGKATTELHMLKGVDLVLASDSRGKLYGDRLVLEKGTSEIRKAGNFRLQANELTILPLNANSKGVVSLVGTRTVDVMALTGAFHVWKSTGELLAKVEPGNALEFSAQPAGSTAPVTIIGTLTKENGHYYITVPETGAKYEIVGKDLDKLVGKKVSVTGTPDPNAAAVIIASDVQSAGSGKVKAGGGMSTGSKVAITSIIVGGGTGLGVGIAEASKSSASR